MRPFGRTTFGRTHNKSHQRYDRFIPPGPLALLATAEVAAKTAAIGAGVQELASTKPRTRLNMPICPSRPTVADLLRTGSNGELELDINTPVVFPSQLMWGETGIHMMN